MGLMEEFKDFIKADKRGGDGEIGDVWQAK